VIHVQRQAAEYAQEIDTFRRQITGLDDQRRADDHDRGGQPPGALAEQPPGDPVERHAQSGAEHGLNDAHGLHLGVAVGKPGEALAGDHHLYHAQKHRIERGGLQRAERLAELDQIAPIFHVPVRVTSGKIGGGLQDQDEDQAQNQGRREDEEGRAAEWR